MAGYNYMVCNRLIDYFKDDIELSLIIEDKIFILTKKDIFYGINIYDDKIKSYFKNNESSMLESMEVKELCKKNIVDLTHGYNHYIARTNSNEIYCWGNNYFGQLGNGKEDNDTMNYNKPFLNELDFEIDVIKCGAFHSIALTRTGEIYAWGKNENGQIGIANNVDYHMVPTKVHVGNDEKIISVSCGFQHSLALTASNRVLGWGDNRCGQLGYEEEEYFNEPILIETNNILIEKISCGPFHSILLSKDGVVLVLGNCFECRTDKKNRKKVKKPYILNHDVRFIDIASEWNENISIGLSTENSYYIWINCREDNGSEQDEIIPNLSNMKIEHFFKNRLESFYCFSRNQEKAAIDNPFLQYHEFIYGLQRGDLIEIDRGKYKHWAFCESKKNDSVWCFHVSKVANLEIKETKRFTYLACIRYELLSDILLNDGNILSKCRVNNQKSRVNDLMRKEKIILIPSRINEVIEELHEYVKKEPIVEYHPKVLLIYFRNYYLKG
jgi:hypothetical protein